MFTILYTKVFPFLGAFFGRLSCLAGSSCKDVIDYLFQRSEGPIIYPKVLHYSNIFTGESLSLSNSFQFISDKLPFLSDINDILNNATNIVFTSLADIYGLINAPFWVAILLFIGSSIFALSIFKFIFG